MIASPLARTLEAAGLTAEAARSNADRLSRLIDGLGRRNWSAWYVPGRIEVLGKHTDYAGGRSLLCTAERGFCLVAAPRDDGQLAITDTGRGSTLVFDPARPAAEVKWATYPRTVLHRLARNFPEATRGAEVRFESDLPSAAGLSSSSALMIGVLLALARVNGLESQPRWTANIGSTEDLAGYTATIENGRDFRGLSGDAGVGTLGGSEDHTAILCSTTGHLAQYAFAPTTRERSIPLAPELIFAIGVSGIVASKIGNARDDYNRASRSVAQILERWCGDTGRRDPSLAAAIGSAPDAVGRLRGLLRGDEVLLDRFDQFVEESSELVPAAANQLATGDLEGFGSTVARSQDLAERLLRNQVPETVALARTARAEGAIAASSFGAGFGGSVWALVERATAHAFLDRWQNAYAAAAPSAAGRSRFFLTGAGPGVVDAGRGAA